MNTKLTASEMRMGMMIIPVTVLLARNSFMNMTTNTTAKTSATGLSDVIPPRSITANHLAAPVW